MESRLLASAAVVGALLLASGANATTYLGSESFDGATVSLSITTDGALGVLMASDITAWNIGITDPAGSVDLTPGNSEVQVFGSVFTATPTDLLFNFSSSFDDSGFLLFQLGGAGNGGPLWCADNGLCSPTQTVPAIVVSTQGQLAGGPFEQLALVGNQVIATSAGAIPEPSTWVMMALGFAGLGFAGYRSARKASAITV